MARIKPPPADVFAGMEEYLSATEGIGGTLKGQAKDFQVMEVTPEGKVLDLEIDTPGDMSPGDYTHFTLVKENWDTMRAVGEIAKRLSVSRNRLAFAGTKDRRAITAQRVSAYRAPIERLKDVRIKDITLKDFSYSDENLGLGSLKGNRFKITVRGVSGGAKERIDATAAELEAGFPNYYGLQRFGELRPITHEVGRHMLKGDFESAVMTYVAKSFDGEDEAATDLRLELSKTRDFQAALNGFPDSFGYEKAMLNHMVQHGDDWAGALRTLPKSLQMMFVHAYQSHVFNRALSECIRRGLTVERLPLVGVDVPPDDISARMMDADGIRREDFSLKGMEELRSRGERRECFTPALDFRYALQDGAATFEFTLGRGSYATVFLREFMKNPV
jgi:tRNA pseudouridine13 synthase